MIKGQKHTLETKEKIRLGHLGYKYTVEAKNKMRIAKLGKKHTKEHNEKISKSLTGRPCLMETRLKIREGNLGPKSHNWKGGITSWRNKIYNSMEYKNWARLVKERDDFTCQICGIRAYLGLGHRVNLRANHIKRFADYPELRFELTNGITICRDCDIKLVMYHELEWESYFNFNLMVRRIN